MDQEKEIRATEAKLQKNLIQQELLSEIAIELNTLENFNDKINKILQKTAFSLSPWSA